MELGHRRGNRTTQHQHPQSKRAPRSSIHLLQPYQDHRNRVFGTKTTVRRPLNPTASTCRNCCYSHQDLHEWNYLRAVGKGLTSLNTKPQGHQARSLALLGPHKCPTGPLGQGTLMRVERAEHSAPVRLTGYTGVPAPTPSDTVATATNSQSEDGVRRPLP